MSAALTATRVPRFSYRNYLLGVLLVIQTFSYVDGLALGLVLQNIKSDLHLSDTQLGLLSGIAFAAFYSIMGIPLARWADRGNRITIIALTTTAWSIMLALCGVARSFGQLLIIRMGVAVGESGCIPPANSLIADYFSRAERPRAVATYMLGPSLSMIIGYLFAGWLNEFFGWRAMFMILGLPGLIPAALAWFTLSEPRRAKSTGENCGSETAGLGEVPHTGACSIEPSMKRVCVSLWNNRTFRHLLLFFSIVYFFGYGILQWQPAYFIRSYGLKTGELGLWFALIYGLGGLLGTYWGGQWASRFAANNEKRQLEVAAIAYAAFGFISLFVYLSPNRYLAFGLMAAAAVGTAVMIGPMFATIQSLVPQRMRAVSIAIMYLSANLIGLGLGPLATGILSDALRPLVGADSLRYALLCLCPGYLWGGWHLWCASRSVAQDLAAVEET